MKDPRNTSGPRNVADRLAKQQEQYWPDSQFYGYQRQNSHGSKISTSNIIDLLFPVAYFCFGPWESCDNLLLYSVLKKLMWFLYINILIILIILSTGQLNLFDFPLWSSQDIYWNAPFWILVVTVCTPRLSTEGLHFTQVVCILYDLQ